MKPLNDIIINPNFEPKPKLTAHIDQLNILIGALRHMSIPDVNIDFINQVVPELNQPFISKSEYMALLTKTKPRILGHLESELKIVPKNYNRKKWMLLGMSAFGIPFGAILLVFPMAVCGGSCRPPMHFPCHWGLRPWIPACVCTTFESL